jgi:hypothetical protein
MSNKQIQSWDWDVRVRDRNLKHGLLDDKIVEKHLGQLADVAEHSEPVTLVQPALGRREE